MRLSKSGLSRLAGTAVLTLALLPAALGAQAAPETAADSFEIRVQNSPALRIAADALTYQQNRMVTLEQTGFIRVEGSGGLSGIISFNSLRYVIARELRTGR